MLGRWIGECYLIFSLTAYYASVPGLLQFLLQSSLSLCLVKTCQKIIKPNFGLVLLISFSTEQAREVLKGNTLSAAVAEVSES